MWSERRHEILLNDASSSTVTINNATTSRSSSSSRSRRHPQTKKQSSRPEITLSRPTLLKGEPNNSSHTILTLDKLLLTANGKFEKATSNRRGKSSPIKIELVDSSELDMLRSINKSAYSPNKSVARVYTPARLYQHEFEDVSDEEYDKSLPMRNVKSASIRRKDIMRGETRIANGGKDEDSNTTSVTERHRSKSAVTTRSEMKKLEEKKNIKKKNKFATSTSRSQQSADMAEDQLQELIYDPDFDCYYDPKNERYYRITQL